MWRNCISLDLLADDNPWHPRVSIDGTPERQDEERERPSVGPLLLLLAKLDERDRQLLTALYWDGKGQRAVAAELGISQPAIHYWHKRIIKKLREAMTDDS